MGIIADIHKDLDRGALQLLVEYRGRLQSEAIRLCGDNAHAEDLVFRTIERVLDRADTYKEDINLFAWMKSIMENIHKDDLKRPVPRGTMAIESGELEKCAGADWSTDEQILRDSDGEVVREALRHIDPEFKQLVLMRYYDEFSLKEIAGILNKPIGTIGRRIQIVHRLLAGKLAAKLGRKPLVVLLAALLGICTLFGAWVSPLGDWVAEKVLGDAPVAQIEPVSPTPVTASVSVGEKAAVPNEATRVDKNPISETKNQEREDNVNTRARIQKTVATAACAAVVCAFGAAAGTDYYVRTNGNDCNDGKTPESARATIAAGMELLTGTGDRLLVGPGVYTNNTAFTVNNGREVIGEEGAEKTCIAIPSNHTLFTFNGTGGGGTVRGFTIAPSAERVQCRVAQMTGAGLLADCIVRDLGTTSGGFVGYQASGDAIISNCCFYGCQGGGRDAAVVEQWSDGQIYDCKFIGCSGNNANYGGAVLIYNGFIRNSLIVCCTNTSMAGGITFCSGNKGYAENCTIADCRTTGSSTVAGGVNVMSGNPNLRNCIVTGCSNSGGAANISGSLTVSCTASSPKPAGEGNIGLENPDFADPTAFDYRVLSGPSIDAGSNKAWMHEATDLAGNNRIINGIVDMGCYENAPSGIKAFVQPSAAVTIGSGQVTLKAIVTAADTNGLTYAWAVTNRMTGVEMLSCAGAQYETVVVDCAVGAYDVALAVANGQGERNEFFRAELFQVKPIDVWVAKGGSATYPYDTRERAFASLSDALNFAEDGMTVIVGDGVYTNSASVTLSHAVTVRGEHGREKTAFVINGDYWHWVLNNARAKIDGLTLNGSYSGGHAVQLVDGRLDNSTITNYNCDVMIRFVKNNIVSNCTITCCRSWGRDPMVDGSGGGEFRDCEFIDNEFCHESEFGGITDGWTGNPKFRNCLIARNRFTHDGPSLTYGFVLTQTKVEGLLENCTIVSNRCTNGTKGRVAITHTAGTIRNCIIAFNENENGNADLSTTVPANVTHALVTTTNVIDTCEGCFVADPKFKHPSRGDYRLKGCSPAIDKALWLPWMEGAKDLNGVPRLLNKAVDLGCYECPLTGLWLILK